MGRLKRIFTKARHLAVKFVLALLWLAVIYQAAVYFVNPVRVESYKLAVEYWQGMWKVLFG